MMPQATWLDQYIAYAQGFTDAPTIFHKYVGLTMIGSAMGNNWKIPGHKGRYEYPNLWVLLIAKSGQLHKSTAAEIGLGLSRESDVPYQASYGSTEGLTKMFLKDPWGVIYADEFDEFMKGMGREYTAGRGFFTSLYDGVIAPQEFNKGSSKGSFSIAASFLACTTMNWLTKHLDEDDLGGGLLPRFLLVPAWKSDRPLMELPPTEIDQRMQLRLTGQLRTIGAQTHICRRSPGADLLYRAWFQRIMSEPLDGTRGEPWPSRVTASCHKLAMIFHANRQGGDGVLSENDMRQACESCSELLGLIKRVLDDELAFTRSEKEIQTLKRVLQNPSNQLDIRSRWVSHAVLLRNAHMDSKQLHAVLETARQSEMIEYGPAKRGFPPVRLITREPGEEG